MALLSRARACAGSALLAMAMQAGWAVPAAPQSRSLEYAVKANYLYKFTPFVEWPPRAFASAAEPFSICVAGRDPFGRALDEAVRGKRVADRPVAVRRLEVVEKGMNCQVLFAGRSEAQGPAAMLQAVTGEPVLTVADEAVRGAMIRFVLVDGRVRFDVDAAAAAAGGLAISSKLVGLSVSRREGRR